METSVSGLSNFQVRQKHLSPFHNAPEWAVEFCILLGSFVNPSHVSFPKGATQEELRGRDSYLLPPLAPWYRGGKLERWG